MAAAALKAQGLAFDPVGRMGLFSTPEVQLAIIEFELFLGLWLWSGKNAAGSWISAVVTFAVFAVVSFYQGWVGQSSCGCFGRLSVNPWYAFGLDVLVLAALVVGRPDLKPLWESSGRSRVAAILPAAFWFAGIVVISGLFLGLAYANFGSLAGTIAYFRGDRISVGPCLVELGAALAGDHCQVTVEVANWTERPIRLIGGTADCSCTVLEDLPLTIPAQEARAVSVEVLFSGKPGFFTRKAGFLVDDEGMQRINFSLTGRILQP